MQLEVKYGTHIPWTEFPHTIPDDDGWVAQVLGYDPSNKYKWEQEFLNDVEKDGDRFIEAFELSGGGVLRVRAGESDRFYFISDASRHSVEIEELTKADAVELVGGNPADLEVGGRFDVDIQLVGDPDDVGQVRKMLRRVGPTQDMEFSFADERYEVEDGTVRVYGDIKIE